MSDSEADPVPVQAAQKAMESYHYMPTEGSVPAVQQRDWHGALPLCLGYNSARRVYPMQDPTNVACPFVKGDK